MVSLRKKTKEQTISLNQVPHTHSCQLTISTKPTIIKNKKHQIMTLGLHRK